MSGEVVLASITGFWKPEKTDFFKVDSAGKRRLLLGIIIRGEAGGYWKTYNKHVAGGPD
jgi:hypothetical protein